MALFNLGKKKTDTAASAKKEEKVAAAKASVVKEAKTEKAPKKASTTVSAVSRTVSHVLLRPRITEKATDATANSVYVFEIDLRSDKRAVREAIKEKYKVNPEKIRIVKLPPKRVVAKMRGGFPGATATIKKAYVYLPKGTTIEIA